MSRLSILMPVLDEGEVVRPPKLGVLACHPSLS